MFFWPWHRRRLRSLELDVEYLMAAIDDLKAQGADTILVLADAVVLIDDIKAKLDAALAAHDEQALMDLAAQLKAATDPLKILIEASKPVA